MSIYDDIAVILQVEDWFNNQIIYEDGLPDDHNDAVCVSIIGGEVSRIHNTKVVAWSHYGIEIRVRAKSSTNARNRIEIAAAALDGITNRYVNGSVIRSSFQIDVPSLMERDPGGETVYAVSFNITRRGR